MAAGRAADPFWRFVWVDGGCIRLPVDAAWHGHERLRVAPHTVLADVEAFHFLARRDAQADGLLDDPEQAVAEHENGDEGGRHGDRLRPELVEIARVEQAALSDTIELGQRGYGEQAAAERAPDPGHTMGGQSADRVVQDLVESEHAHDH